MNPDEELKRLREENETLKKQNAIKADWISISAHQLRTSLSAIKWILKMFLDADFGKLTTEQESFMKKAFESTDRMVSLVSEMLSLNHGDHVELHYEFTEHNLFDLLESVLFDFTSESYKRGVELIFLKPEQKIPHLLYDEEKIRVVLQNLIENAIKYSEKGDRIFISIKEKEGMVEIAVKDTGIGIPEGERGQIFEKFFRASNAKAKDTIGSGVGLFTTKKIVEAHGGKIWFENGERGTTFYFTLPLKREAPTGN